MPEKNNKKNKSRGLTTAAIVLMIAIVTLLNSLSANVEDNGVKYEEFLEMVEAGSVKTITWAKNDETMSFVDSDEKLYTTENPKYDDFKKDMLEKGVEVKEASSISDYDSTILILVQIALYGVFFSILAKSTGMISLPEKKSKNEEKCTVKFKDVAGLDEVKEDLMTVVDFLKNPKEYKDAGAEIPKGILLYGPPGTGKTLLAKAIAGEANVKFRAASGSDFDEKYVGVGSSRIRKMFAEAKKNAPCIIFIDEIDSLGSRRHAKQTGSDRQTLNTLLSEMDGFDGSDGVVVIAATNRLEDLDSALTRPGRFDNHFAVSLPATAKERMLIIDLYAKNKKFADDVDLTAFSKETLGSSPAAIKSALNEAAIIATRKNNGIITRAILDEAWMKQLMEGHLKKNGEKDNAELIAYHEAGHALVGLLLGQDLTKTSIIPSTSGAGGATFITPRKLGLFSKKELKEQVMMLYAGRCAELIYTGSENLITTGASNDIERATEIIRQMITDYGMSNRFGMLSLDSDILKQEMLLEEMCDISNSLTSKTKRLLAENKETLTKIANALVEKETLTGEEVRKIAEG